MMMIFLIPHCIALCGASADDDIEWFDVTNAAAAAPPLKHAGDKEENSKVMIIDDNCDDTDECENYDDIMRTMLLSHWLFFAIWAQTSLE